MLQSFISPRMPRGPLPAASCLFFLGLLTGCDDGFRPDPVAQIEVTGEMAFLDVGETLQLTAFALTAGGSPLPQAEILWSSSDTTVARVDGGLVEGVSPGPVSIVARNENVWAAFELTIEPVVASVAVEPATLALVLGGERQITTDLRDQNAHPMTHSVHYVSSAPEVVEVSESGLVTSTQHGTATITVIVGRTRVEIPVSVEAGYSLTVLPGFMNGESRANDINQHGVVAGRAQGPDRTWHAVLWENGTLHDLGNLGFAFNEAVALNDDGIVVGNARPSECLTCVDGGPRDTHPWKWDRDGLVQIDVQKPSIGTLLTDVNNLGQVSGHTAAYGSRFSSGEAFIWKDGETTWLGTRWTSAHPHNPPNPTKSSAFAINDAGMVAGSISFYGQEEHPAVWSDGQWLDGPHRLYGGARATDINEKGQVLVGSQVGCIGFYLWGATTCPSPAGSPARTPHAIDNHGRIVGAGISRSGENFGFLWRDSLLDLNDLVAGDEWQIEAATGINDRGQIVGWGRHRTTGVTSALILDPLQ